MNSQKQTWEIKDIAELRVVLQDIADENSGTRLNQQLQEYLQYEQQMLQKLADRCLQQLTRKQSHIQNLIDFSLHMLLQIQHKSQQLALAQERVQYLQEDLKKANAYNLELMGRLEDVEEENSQYAKREEQNSQVISRIEETKSLLLEQLSYQQARGNCTIMDIALFDGEEDVGLRKRKSIEFENNNNEDKRNNYMLKSSIHTFKSHLNPQLYNTTNPLIKCISHSSHNSSHSSHNSERFTQRSILGLPQQHSPQVITIQQHEHQLSNYKSSLQNKQHQINNLQSELHMLKSQISTLSNQLMLKQSQLELSQIYFKQKLEIVQCRSDIETKRHDEFNQDDVKAVFKRELARVESVESIQSVGRSDFSQDPFNNVADLIKQQYAHSDHNHHHQSKRSLMQEFFPDFLLVSNHRQQICYTQPFSEIDHEEGRSEIKKALSVSTADIKKVQSKGVQTVGNIDERVIGRIVKGQNIWRENQKTNNLQQSFLGSVVSLFAKKPQPKTTTTNNKSFSKQQQAKNNKSFSKQQSKIINKQSSFLDSSIGLFKGIYDYATKKIVTNRIHKKKVHNSNNLYVLDELKPTKKTGYYKGMKCY